MLAKDMQREKARFPMRVTDWVMVTETRFSNLLKA